MLKDVKAGVIQTQAAVALIRRARARAESARRLLRNLGETNERLPLGARFRRLTRRLDAACQDDAAAQQYASLTQAMHQLNLIISRSFYR